MIRLGFAVRAVGRPELNGGGGATPHLSRTLAALGDMLSYLAHIGVGFYRVALAPGPAFAELADCAAQIELLAQRLAAARLRLGVHLPPGLALGSADGASVARAIDTIEATAALLALLDGRAPPAAVEHTMVAHLGAAAADGASLGRFAARYRALSAQARAPSRSSTRAPGRAWGCCWPCTSAAARRWSSTRSTGSCTTRRGCPSASPSASPSQPGCPAPGPRST
jgi:hypothetical protein